MFSRRPITQQNRGRIVRAGGIVTPLTILGAAGMLRWVRSDLGITIGTGVSAWADQSGAGNDYTMGTAANQPAIVPAGLNGHDTLLFDGSNDFLESALSLPAPGTTPTFRIFVVKQITWIANRSFCGGSTANTHRIRQAGASPEVDIFNGTDTANNNGAVIGEWRRWLTWLNNATTDYLTIGSTTVTGINAGNAASVGTQLGCQASVGFWGGEAAEEITLNYKPTAGKLTELDAYITSRYGAGLV